MPPLWRDCLPDGHCWDCGADQEGFHAHGEVVAEGGAAGVGDRGLRRGINADAMALVEVGAWTVGVACDGVSMPPRSERAAGTLIESEVLVGRAIAKFVSDAYLTRKGGTEYE